MILLIRNIYIQKCTIMLTNETCSITFTNETCSISNNISNGKLYIYISLTLHQIFVFQITIRLINYTNREDNQNREKFWKKIHVSIHVSPPLLHRYPQPTCLAKKNSSKIRLSINFPFNQNGNPICKSINTPSPVSLSEITSFHDVHGCTKLTRISKHRRFHPR